MYDQKARWRWGFLEIAMLLVEVSVQQARQHHKYRNPSKFCLKLLRGEQQNVPMSNTTACGIQKNHRTWKRTQEWTYSWCVFCGNELGWNHWSRKHMLSVRWLGWYIWLKEKDVTVEDPRCASSRIDIMKPWSDFLDDKEENSLRLVNDKACSSKLITNRWSLITTCCCT